jgi:hypothetical protein
MRWLGILVRVVGWLLTPLVVWAASFSGAWLVLQVAPHIEQPRRALMAALAAALVAGIGVMLLWMRLLRRSPRLRHSLHVDREGLPVIEEIVAATAPEAAKATAAPEKAP